MRHIYIIFLFLFLSTNCFAQTKEERQAILDARKKGIQLNYKNEDSTYNGHYAIVMATSKFLSKKVTITVDYGNRSGYVERDENGEIIVFNTVVDALNYMYKKGWSFVDAYAITVGNQNVYHYLFEKNSKKID